MYTLTLLELCALALSVLFTLLCRAVALRVGLVDMPDLARKRHAGPTARIGGAAVVLSVIGTFALLGGLTRVLPPAFRPVNEVFLRLLPAMLVVFATGLIDDVRKLTPVQKLLGQSAAAALAVAAGVQVWPGAAGWHAGLGAVATGIWLVFCSNSVNLIDGVDGLAGGTSLIAALALLGGALMYNQYALACAMASLVGAIAGFLAYNISPAWVFLGDSGSLTIGFLLGCYASLWAGNLAPVPAMVSVVLMMAVPFADTGFAVLRRLANGRHVFEADRCHIHHRLLDRGLSSNRVTMLLCAFSTLAAGCALAVAGTGNPWWLALPAVAALSVFTAGRATAPEPVPHSLSRAVEVRRALEAIERRFSRCFTADECWMALTAVAAQFGISDISLEMGDVVYEKRTLGPGKGERWKLTVPLPSGVLVRVVASFHRGLERSPLIRSA